MASSIDLSTATNMRYSFAKINDTTFIISFYNSLTDEHMGSITFPTSKSLGLFRHLETIVRYAATEFDVNEVAYAKFDSTTGQGVIEFAPPPETRL